MASFIASKSQPLCKSCCIEQSTAHLDVSRKKRKRIVKSTFTEQDVRLLMFEAYAMCRGTMEYDDFSEWVEIQIKDYGNNSSKKR